MSGQPQRLSAPIGTISPLVRSIVLFSAILAATMIVRFEVIALPPYYDYAMGLWTEADFLAESGFDYRALRYEQDHSFEKLGGARSYMTSLLPSVVALCMITTSTPHDSFVAYHLFIFACSSATLTLFFLLLRANTNRIVAAWSTLAVATTPVFAVQVDMTSMEMPLILGAMLTCWAIRKRRYDWAAIASTASFFMKPTGAVLTMATICLLVLQCCTTRECEIRSICRKGLVWNVAVLAIQGSVLLWGASFDKLVHPASGPLFQMAWYWFPDMVLLLMLCGLIIVATLVTSSVQRPQASSDSIHGRIRQVLNHWLQTSPVACYAIIVVGGLLVAVQIVFFIPRYFALLVPFLYLILATFSWFWAMAARRAVGLGMRRRVECPQLEWWALRPDT